MSGVDCTSAVKGNLQETPLMEQGKENRHCWRDQFWHPWIPPSDLKGVQGPPCPSAALQLLTNCVSGAVSLFYQLKSSSTKKITKPGCIRFFLLCPGPTLNLQIGVIWMGLGGKRGQQSPPPHRRADPQTDSLFLTLFMEEQSLPKIFWNKWNNNIAIIVALSAMTIAWIDL